MRFTFGPVLAVCWAVGVALPAGAATYYASPTGADTNPGTSARPWRTLQPANKTLKPGDTLLIADGQYPGNIRQTVSGQPGKPITFKSINPGKAIIRGDVGNAPDAFVVYQANWIVIDGLALQGSVRNGLYVATSDNVVVRNCIARNNGVTGILTGFCDDVLIENNECAFNREQHGVYISCAGDRPIVRHNVLHDNGRCGVQLNGDGKSSRPGMGSRYDGIISNADVEDNVIYNNGPNGGAAINLASVRNSLISNNLIFNNVSGGIALFNDNIKPAVQWGSKNNMIVSNTIYFRPHEGRWCLSFVNGSTGNFVANNILSGGGKGAYSFDGSSSFAADHNLAYSSNCPFVATNETTGRMLKPLDYYKLTGNDAHSVLGNPEFANPTGVSPDFHLKSGSPAWHMGMVLPQVTTDADGKAIAVSAAPCLGCYGGATAAAANVAN